MRWTGPVLAPESGPPFDWEGAGLNRLLIGATDLKASDIILQTDMPAMALIHERLHALTHRAINKNAMEQIAQKMADRGSAIASLQSASPIRKALQLDGPGQDKDGFPPKYRFRANISPMDHSSKNGIQIVARTIAMSPPTLADLRLEPEIVAAAYPNRGMVLLAGPTGSGKTSTTASLIRNIVEGNADIAGNLLLFENPIEFLYSEIPSSCCTVAQHEIPTHLPSFEEAIADSLRRHPALIQIQELRYISEISAATRAANTGLPVYASVHANSAAHVIARLVEEFPDSQRDAAFSNILETTQLIVAQVLVRRRDGKGMVCLREWIDIDNRTRARLHRAGRVSCTDVVRQILNEGEAAQSMEKTVARHFAAGEIDAHTAARVLSGFGYDEEARQMRSGAATERQATTSRELEAAY